MPRGSILIIFILLPFLVSCSKNEDSLKQKELALKEKELQLKEREMNAGKNKTQIELNENQNEPQLNSAREYSPIHLNGTYSGTIKDGTSWHVSINSFDGKNFSGYNIIYWKNHPEGYKAYFTGTFNNSSREIMIFEDKTIKNSGMFTGNVSYDGITLNGDWRRYSDNGSYTWNLVKTNDEN